MLLIGELHDDTSNQVRDKLEPWRVAQPWVLESVVWSEVSRQPLLARRQVVAALIFTRVRNTRVEGINCSSEIKIRSLTIQKNYPKAT
jgi:hypothetical protein